MEKKELVPDPLEKIEGIFERFIETVRKLEPDKTDEEAVNQ